MYYQRYHLCQGGRTIPGEGAVGKGVVTAGAGVCTGLCRPVYGDGNAGSAVQSDRQIDRVYVFRHSHRIRISDRYNRNRIIVADFDKGVGGTNRSTARLILQPENEFFVVFIGFVISDADGHFNRIFLPGIPGEIIGLIHKIFTGNGR